MEMPSDFRVQITGDRVVTYEDSHGGMRFFFDLNLSKGPKALLLERTACGDDSKPLERSTDQSRSDAAFDRAKAHLESVGYDITAVDS